jgi:DNA-binding transcriptional LysR family regulator
MLQRIRRDDRRKKKDFVAMNLRFVEAFYWVVSLKSVSRAAEKLFITQSAMSSRVAALEEELGVLLLDRRDKQFRLTVAGMRFFNHAQKLLALQRDIKAEMSAAGGNESATVSLRIGVIESVLHSWLIDWINHMRKSSPGFEPRCLGLGLCGHADRGRGLAQPGLALHGHGFRRTLRVAPKTQLRIA